jgi:tetrahydromethanopterin S-methyltransferase subunit F
MSPSQNLPGIPDINRASGAAVGFFFASIIFCIVALIVRTNASVPPIDAGRATTLSSALFEIRTNETVALDSAAWIDRGRGIVRLPIATAERLAAQEWRNPVQARADLIAREKRASAPAPKPAATANQFE